MEKILGVIAMTMKPVYVNSDHLITSLGEGTSNHFNALEEERCGIMMHHDPRLYPTPMPISLVDTSLLEERFQETAGKVGAGYDPSAFTRLEKMFIVSIFEALSQSKVKASDPDTFLVLSSTKGNIDLLEERYKLIFPHKRVYLWEMARVVARVFGFRNPPLIISNACISGVMAIMTASRYLRSGKFRHAIVTGGDIATEFVISGFQSFQALSPAPCKPFDLNRTGLSIGEGCGTMVLSVNPPDNITRAICVGGSAVTNDANHISGPSRTGEELALAIRLALSESNLSPEAVGYVSAHGTATPYNDEMESKALHISGLAGTPVNSFKGFIGHTLGAAGIIESILGIGSLQQGLLFRSLGYETQGTPVPLNIITRNTRAGINAFVKTASGFGGCNAAITFF